jgi:hypothetical protein
MNIDLPPITKESKIRNSKKMVSYLADKIKRHPGTPRYVTLSKLMKSSITE